jgi:predicted nucleotidyltransferase
MKNDFEEVLKEAKEQDEILGLILVGSRGKGFENEYSDYDLIMIVKDEAVSLLSEKYKQRNLVNVDLVVQSLSDFKKYAEWDSPETWDRYNYAHCKVLLDKTNDLPKLIQEKGYVPEDKLNKFIDYWIDGYVNGVFRSVKCIRNNNSFGAHLEAVNSMLDLLTLTFAFNGRHRPFLGYVQKEFEMYPLQNLPWSSAEFVQKIEKVLATADLKTQQELLIGVEKMSRENGHGKMFDGWEGKDKWAMTFEKI